MAVFTSFFFHFLQKIHKIFHTNIQILWPKRNATTKTQKRPILQTMMKKSTQKHFSDVSNTVNTNPLQTHCLMGGKKRSFPSKNILSMNTLSVLLLKMVILGYLIATEERFWNCFAVPCLQASKNTFTNQKIMRESINSLILEFNIKGNGKFWENKGFFLVFFNHSFTNWIHFTFFFRPLFFRNSQNFSMFAAPQFNTKAVFLLDWTNTEKSLYLEHYQPKSTDLTVCRIGTSDAGPCCRLETSCFPPTTISFDETTNSLFCGTVGDVVFVANWIFCCCWRKHQYEINCRLKINSLKWDFIICIFIGLSKFWVCSQNSMFLLFL